MLNSKKVLFVLAHYDDESFSAGTIKKMVDKGIEVSVLFICGLGKDLEDKRRDVCWENSKLIGYTPYDLRYFDLTLNSLDNDVRLKMEQSVRDYIFSFAPDTVITNHGGDLHSDHRFVSKMVRIITRPSQHHNIKNLYECYVPGAAEYDEGTQMFNTVIDITSEFREKIKCLANYNLSTNGVSNLNGAEISSKYFGNLYGVGVAEIFKPIYCKG